MSREGISSGEGVRGQADETPPAHETLNCLVYVPNIYNGGGTTQTLVWIVEQFERAGILATLCFQRSWQFPRNIQSASLFPSILRRMPGRWTNWVPIYWMERAFLKRLSTHSPDDTFVYFWPEPRTALISAIKARGFCVFRELINCPGQVCVSEVNKARLLAGLDELPPSDSGIANEWEQIELSDFVTAPNAEVEKSLLALGLSPKKIVPTSFGWADDRFPGMSPALASIVSGDTAPDRPFVVLFVGHIGVRKGVHYLFDIWKDLPSNMHLQVVGTVDAEMEPMLEKALRQDDRIEQIPFTSELERIFRSADVFAFPTVEEGGPQVTFEAAGCGLPVVTTPMGAARLVTDGHNGLIVPPHDAATLKTALLDLYEHPDKRDRLARQAQVDAQDYTYKKVGMSRANLFRQKFADFRRKAGS